MIRRLILRLIQAIIVMLVLSFVVYGLMGLMPGDPIELMAAGSPHMDAADVTALVNRPSLLLCDEPTGNLDSRNAAIVMDLLSQLAPQLRKNADEFYQRTFTKTEKATLQQLLTKFSQALADEL